MQLEGKSRRLRERLEMPLPVRVHCRESADHGWVEKTRLIDITPFGARLTIGRPTETGRLLHLTMPLPSQLRSFDYGDEQYNVWSLVRHAAPLASQGGRLPRFEIGVAFIGKQAPLSFETDPSQRYEIAGAPAAEKLWHMRERFEAEATSAPYGERRADARRVLAVDVLIEVYDENGKVFATEETATENISRRGMAVTTRLNIVRGRYVRVSSAHYDIAVFAAVRRLRKGADGLARLHLEFVDKQWPPLEESP
ncbi:MAG TPA: PilZ domain-containing protein [Pyrinomonadaceae bacterium]|nr:PilZ domain-containing protein [Pyrinomonadaceae bacterium]